MAAKKYEVKPGQFWTNRKNDSFFLVLKVIKSKQWDVVPTTTIFYLQSQGSIVSVAHDELFFIYLMEKHGYTQVQF